MPSWLGAAFAAAVFLTNACAARAPLPVRAASLEASECRDALPPEDEARALESMTVVAASARFRQSACNGECRVTGVRLDVLPRGEVTLERFAQMLRCHSLRVIDGEVDASRIRDDPYGVRDTWVDIDVSRGDGHFVVTLIGDTFADTLRIQRRAMMYAAAHGVVWRWY
jgi:hypothetical protein